MTAASKRPGGNKQQPKRPLFKQVLSAPVTTKWPSVSEKQTRLIKEALQKAATGLQDKQRLRPPWRELKMIPKDQRAVAIEKFKEQYLSGVDAVEREEFLELEKLKKEKNSQLVFGYNEIMRHLTKGTLAAVLVNKTATPDFLAKSFLPGCYCRNIPAVAIENLHEVLGKCIGVGLREHVKEESSPFHNLYALMKDTTQESSHAQRQATLPTLTKVAVPIPKRKRSFECAKVKIPPPIVDVSKFHLVRGSREQAVFLSKLAGKQWSGDVITLASDIPTNTEAPKAFDFRKTKKARKVAHDDSKRPLGDDDKAPCQKSLLTQNFSGVNSDVMFELDFGGESENKTENEVGSLETRTEATDEQFTESSADNLSVGKSRDSLAEAPASQQKKRKRKAREVEEKLSGVSSYVPAAVARVVKNPEKKKKKKKQLKCTSFNSATS